MKHYPLLSFFLVGTFFSGCEDEYCNRDGTWCDGHKLMICHQEYMEEKRFAEYKVVIDCKEYGMECDEWSQDDGNTSAGCKVINETCAEYFGEDMVGYTCINNMVANCGTGSEYPVVQTGRNICDKWGTVCDEADCPYTDTSLAK